jgi:hypothetical protein
MSDIISTLLLRNLQEVFGEGDPARRRAAIEDLYTEDCVILLPTGRHVGRKALDQIAGELRAGHPTFVYTPHTIPQAVQDGGRIAWGSGPAGAAPVHGPRRHHRPRREDLCPLRLPRLAAGLKRIRTIHAIDKLGCDKKRAFSARGVLCLSRPGS